MAARHKMGWMRFAAASHADWHYNPSRELSQRMVLLIRRDSRVGVRLPESLDLERVHEHPLVPGDAILLDAPFGSQRSSVRRDSRIRPAASSRGGAPVPESAGTHRLNSESLMKVSEEEQVRVLADLYSQRAAAYNSLWSPVIRPVGERLLEQLPLSGAEKVIDVGTGAGALLPAIQRAAPKAVVLGVDRSEGMLRLAKQKHLGPVALMDVQRLGLPTEDFDDAVVAFVLFHLPNPERCIAEVLRVLRPGGMVGTATWAVEHVPPANTIWDVELTAAGAPAFELPATDNRSCCDSAEKMTRLLRQTGFVAIRTWTESLEHRWRAEDYFEYNVRSTSRARLQSLGDGEREACLRSVRDRLAGLGQDQYIFRGDVVMATASKPTRLSPS
jgi:ubiquinone/menaquinone biosynthesis C-methylase UbiE